MFASRFSEHKPNIIHNGYLCHSNCNSDTNKKLVYVVILIYCSIIKQIMVICALVKMNVNMCA